MNEGANEIGSWPTSLVDVASKRGLLAFPRPVILGGVQCSIEEIKNVSEMLGTLIEVLAKLPDVLGAKGWQAIASQICLTNREIDFMMGAGTQPDASAYARADMVRTTEGFKLVELNVGSCVGGIADGALPSLTGLEQRNDPLSAWAEYVSKRIPYGSSGVILYDGHPQSEWNHDIQLMAQALQRISNSRVSAGRRLSLHWDGKSLCNDTDPIDWIYPAVFDWEIFKDSEYYSPILTALNHEALLLPLHFFDRIMGNKALLALAYDAAIRGKLTEREAHSILTILPKTEVLTTGSIPWAARNAPNLVIKPSAGSGGAGVIIGKSVSQKHWESELRNAASSPPGHYIIQRYCDPILEPILAMSPGAPPQRFIAPYVWGFFIGDGTMCGTPFLRANPNENSSSVINCSTGAIIGPFPPVDKNSR